MWCRRFWWVSRRTPISWTAGPPRVRCRDLHFILFCLRWRRECPLPLEEQGYFDLGRFLEPKRRAGRVCEEIAEAL